MHVIQLALFIAFLKKNEKSGVQFSLIQVKVESKNNHTIFTLFFQGTLHTPRSGEAKPSCHEEGNFLTFPPQKAPVSSSAGPSHVAHKCVCVCAGNMAGPELEAGSPTSQPACLGHAGRTGAAGSGHFTQLVVLSHPYSFASSARDSSLKLSFVLILVQVKHAAAAISLRV